MQAARAGLALACAYSSSDEYEAAVIRARRDAGAYGGRPRQRQLAMVVAATAAVVLLIAVI